MTIGKRFHTTWALAFAAAIGPMTAVAQMPQQAPPDLRVAEGRTLAPTPAQMEGPYYPVQKLDDRDSNLTRVGDAQPARGTVLVLSGRLVDPRNTPLRSARVEIWQADDSGIYMHPNDPRTRQRDEAFQFYGEAVTDAEGAFRFRTIMPGFYGERPRHIHIKVVPREGPSLTTQLYFRGDDRIARDGLTRRLGDRISALLLDPRRQADGELTADATLVLDAR